MGPCKVTGKCGSVWVRLIPAPRGTGIVSAPVPKKLLQMAGIDDCYTSARGPTGTLGNFAKATYAAVAATYAYLTPDLWKDHLPEVSIPRVYRIPVQEPQTRGCSETGSQTVLGSDNKYRIMLLY